MSQSLLSEHEKLHCDGWKWVQTHSRQIRTEGRAGDKLGNGAEMQYLADRKRYSVCVEATDEPLRSLCQVEGGRNPCKPHVGS